MILTAQGNSQRTSIGTRPTDPHARVGPMLSGILHATAVTVRVERGIIAGWLPPGITFPDSRQDLHPLIIVWGSQEGVSAFPGGGRLPFPWRLNYSEVITAVPDLRLDSRHGHSQVGPVTYLPRLYMNSWRAVMLGRAVYGFRKAYARIEDTPNSCLAVNRHGEQLLRATLADHDTSREISPSGPKHTNQLTLFDQPVVLEATGSPMLARFDLHPDVETVRRVSVEITVQQPLLSYLPTIRYPSRLCDADDEGALCFSAPWTLTQMASHPRIEQDVKCHL